MICIEMPLAVSLHCSAAMIMRKKKLGTHIQMGSISFFVLGNSFVINNMGGLQEETLCLWRLPSFQIIFKKSILRLLSSE